jgi:hypothetical protein
MIGETPEWMLWVLVGLLTVIMCLPGLKSLLRPRKAAVMEDGGSHGTKGTDPCYLRLKPFRSNEWRYRVFVLS